METFKPVSKKNKILVQGFLSGIRIQSDYQFTGIGLEREEFRKLMLKQREMIEAGFDVIPNKLKIRKVNEYDIKRIKGSPMEWWFGRLPSNEDIILEWFVEDEAYIERPSLIDDVLLALRLLKRGFVNLEKYYFVSLDGQSHGIDGDKIRMFESSEQYHLFPKDIEPLIIMVNRITTVDFDRHRAYAVACRRFGQSCDDQFSEDRIVDMYIAFEALYCKEKPSFAKGRMIGEKASKLLSDDEKTQEAIKDALVDGYNLRNGIVHGDEVDLERCVNVGNHIEEMLRKSLVKLMPV